MGFVWRDRKATGPGPLSRGLPDPDQLLTLGGLLFAGVTAWRLGPALRVSSDPEIAVRGALAALLPALVVLVATQVALSEGTRIVLWVLAAPPDWLAPMLGEGGVTAPPAPDSVVEHLLTVAWAVVGRLAYAGVLLGAFLSTSRWLSALIEVVVASFVLTVTLWAARFVAELVSAMLRGVVSLVLGCFGLGFVGPLLELVDQLADGGFVVLACGWVLAGCWLVAVELLPRVVQGEQVRFVDSLMHLLNRTPRPPG